jgi:hypothetical protein
MLEYLNPDIIEKEQAIKNNPIQPISQSETVEEKIISLLEERLTINSLQHKLGEVIIYKQVETQIVEVPIRREKLIIEQVSPEYKILAEVDLSQDKISSVDLKKPDHTQHLPTYLTVSSEFDSLKTASLLLELINQDSNHGCQRLKVEITVENESQRQKCQEYFQRFSQLLK